jgi:hypothetical protein
MDLERDNKVILEPNRFKFGVFALFCAFCVLVFCSEFVKQTHAFQVNYLAVGIGVFGLAFCVLGLIILISSTFSPHMNLTLSREGMKFGYAFRSVQYRWVDIADFWESKLRHRHAVGFNFSSEYLRDSNARYKNHDDRRICRLLPDTYGMSANELKAALIDWKNRAADTVTHS